MTYTSDEIGRQIAELIDFQISASVSDEILNTDTHCDADDPSNLIIALGNGQKFKCIIIAGD